MVASSLCGDNPAPKHFENLRENKKVNCPCYTQCKQELPELLLELKSVTKNINIPTDGPNCDMNQTNECKKCHILSSQLQEAVTELKSAQFIIKLLQDEVLHVTGWKVISLIKPIYKSGDISSPSN